MRISLKIAALALAGCMFQNSASLAHPAEEMAWVSKVGTRSVPSGKKVFSVNDYGVKVDDTTKVVTKGIQDAIDACAKKGGGVVTFKPGRYVTGSIFLKSNVTLQLDKGVELLGSQSFDDYPEIDTRIAGIEMKWPAALINVLKQKNVAITGEGRINARGKFCWDKYWAMRKEYEAKGLRWIVDYDAKRVRTILVQESSDVLLKGFTVANAGFWTVQILYSDHITVDALTIRNNEDGKGPSTDGVDIDSSTWVLVENCDIDCNDDDFCLKSGRDWDGLRVNKPTEYVVIRKCVARKGGGLLTLGSETSGGIRHVLATDLHAKGTGTGFHIKSAITRGGVIEDIHFENAEMDEVRTAFMFTMNWNPAYSYSKLPDGYDPATVPEHWKKLLRKPEPESKGIPQFKDVYVSGVKVTNAQTAISAAGMEGSTLDRFHFENVQVNAEKAGKIDFAKDWEIKNIDLRSADNSHPAVTNSTGMGF